MLHTNFDELLHFVDKGNSITAKGHLKIWLLQNSQHFLSVFISSRLPGCMLTLHVMDLSVTAYAN